MLSVCQVYIPGYYRLAANVSPDSPLACLLIVIAPPPNIAATFPQDYEALAEWVNPEYLGPTMLDQCATAFNENGSTIQLHRFLKVLDSQPGMQTHVPNL